jgi:hypothetical protein
MIRVLPTLEPPSPFSARACFPSLNPPPPPPPPPDPHHHHHQHIPSLPSQGIARDSHRPWRRCWIIKSAHLLPFFLPFSLPSIFPCFLPSATITPADFALVNVSSYPLLKLLLCFLNSYCAGGQSLPTSPFYSFLPS